MCRQGKRPDGLFNFKIIASHVALTGDEKRLAAKLKILLSNYFELYSSKLFDTNPLLREKEIILNPRGAWKILIKFNLANRAVGAENPTHSLMLGLLDKLRTFFQKNPDSDL